MAIGHIGNAACRIMQIISGAVVLGLAVKTVDTWNYYHYLCQFVDNNDAQAQCYAFVGRWPASLEYAAFCGAFGLLAALVGFLPTFISSSIVLMASGVLDILATIFYFAGGVNLAVLYHNYGSESGLCYGDDTGNCQQLATRTAADIAFLFIGFFFTLFSLVTLFLIRRHNN